MDGNIMQKPLLEDLLTITYTHSSTVNRCSPGLSFACMFADCLLTMWLPYSLWKPCPLRTRPSLFLLGTPQAPATPFSVNASLLLLATELKRQIENFTPLKHYQLLCGLRHMMDTNAGCPTFLNKRTADSRIIKNQ